MPGQRQDYLLTQIELLRQFVARLLHARDRSSLDEALRLALGMQEKLFPLPVADFLSLEVSEQLTALQAGLSPSDGRQRGLLYAELLQTTATLYDYRGRPDLAQGARQLALHIALHLSLSQPQGLPAAAAMIRTLRPLLEPAELHPPVNELLQQFEAGPN